MEPSVVGHEFTHGITHHTANLAYEYESGALNESFSDIFGIVIQAQTLDWGSTDWIMGNLFPNTLEFTRSLSSPNTRGSHWTGNYDINNNPIYDLGQPDYYEGNNWCNCPYDVDYGGLHINSGVQNKWFQALSAGETSPTVQGIGMTKAAQIAYYALTSILMNSSQYSDSKQATITASILLFGECSQEHKSTVNAWNYVGIYASYNCTVTSIDEIVDVNDVLVYPNPASSTLYLELPQVSENPIQIFDINGKLVKTIESTDLYFQTNISNLENGVYLLYFNFNGQQIVKRIIVQK
jgi:bacillolysin